MLLPSGESESREAQQTVVVIQSIAQGDSLPRYLEIGERPGFTPKEVHLTVAENIGRLVSSDASGL